MLLVAQSSRPLAIKSLEVHFRVIGAILIRDMRSRFGRSHLTYLIAIGWPLSHLTGLVAAFTLVNRVLPFGTDSIVFITTGALPYVLCLYPARWMAMTFMQNFAMLNFSVVHPVHMIVARMVLETLNCFTVVLIFTFALWASGAEIEPQDIPTALLAMYASVFFGISVGTFTIVLRAIFKMPGYYILILTMIGLYMSSGVYLPVAPSSEIMRTLVGLNPIYQLVQWTRSAFFETHTAVPLDKAYVLLLASFLLFIGLLGERLLRGRIVGSV
ncbi:MAG: capsular polysaccharide transport system permease protein [Methylobacteriaceae bacterium]|nr:capsular polysaccharide transport system permease protein [Methylobacteriaceae bacterium]